MKESSVDESSTNSNQINKPTKNSEYHNKQTYRIYGFVLVLILAFVFVLLSFFLFGKGIYDIINSSFEINNFLGSIIIFLIAGVMTYYFPFISSITVDMSKKIVTIKKYRFFFLKNKTTKIDIDNITRAYTVKNKDEGYGINQNNYDGFDLIFILNNGHRIVGLEGEIDKNNEKKKLDFFLRQFFPGSLETESDDTVYIQMQNFNSQYQPINNQDASNNQSLQNNLINNEKSENKKDFNIFLGINEQD